MTASRWLWSLRQGTSKGLAQCRMTPNFAENGISYYWEMYILAQNISNYVQVFPFFFSFSRKACLRSLKTDVVLRPIASLKALLAANTIKKSRKFCVTRNHSDSFESVFQRSGTLLNGSGYPFEENYHPFEQLWLPFRKRNVIPMTQAIRLKKLSSVGIVRATRLKNNHPFKRLTTFRNQFCPNRLWRTWQKNVSLNDLLNSSRHSLPWPHEFSCYIFRWVAFFITFNYRYNNFYSRLSYNLRARTLFWKKNWRTFQALSRTHFPLFKDLIQFKKEGGGT